ncbi:MAG: hypothetical protein Kow00124_31600 [Anaerolineae bacterium]
MAHYSFLPHFFRVLLAAQLLLQPMMQTMQPSVPHPTGPLAAAHAQEVDAEPLPLVPDGAASVPATARLPVSAFNIDVQLEAARPTNYAEVGSEPVYLANKSQIGRTWDIFSGDPHWEDVKGTGITGMIYDFVLDERDPYQIAYVATSEGLWRTGSLGAASPTWDQIFSGYVRRVLILPTGRLFLTHGTTTFHYSDTEGASWGTVEMQEIDRPWYYEPAINEAITVSPGGILYAGGLPPAGAHHLIASYDGGLTWYFLAHTACTHPGSVFSPQDGLVYLVGVYGDICMWEAGSDPDPMIQIPTSFPVSSKPYDALLPWPDGGFVVIDNSDEQRSGKAWRYDGEGFVELFTGTLTTLVGSSLYRGTNASTPLVSSTTRQIAWAALAVNNNLQPLENTIIVSSDGGSTWADATGDWYSVFGSWEGSEGSSAAPCRSSPGATTRVQPCASGCADVVGAVVGGWGGVSGTVGRQAHSASAAARPAIILRFILLTSGPSGDGAAGQPDRVMGGGSIARLPYYKTVMPADMGDNSHAGGLTGCMG